jgi:hypothetical protein
MKTIVSLLIVFIISLSDNLYAQIDTSTLNLPKSHISNLQSHNPKIAAYLSIIPGAGQIYNKKYWKVPIIYAALGTASYFFYTYYKATIYYRDEYVYRLNNEVPFHNPELENTLTDNVLALRNTYRSRMEISIAAFAIVYALNIVDATVDAHLYYFDVSDDLSMTIKPTFQLNPSLGSYAFSPGIGIKLKLK